MKELILLGLASFSATYLILWAAERFFGEPAERRRKLRASHKLIPR
ncbi:MAG: hypothetical protein Q8M88_11815 [Phenylobacterium sp.]|nr:hypothetical protein [Phenylobacterium sp.]MDP3175108.1 hypothetical protein [Phenylobacterium sp.]